MSHSSNSPRRTESRGVSRSDQRTPSHSAGEGPQMPSTNWYQSHSGPGVHSDVPGAQQGYPAALNMGQMSASLPPTQQPPRQGSSYPYAQPVAYYPVYAPGPSSPQRYGYVPQSYPQHQPHWSTGPPGPRYPQGQALYDYAATLQYPSSAANPTVLQAQGQASPSYQYVQYGDPQQFVQAASTIGSSSAMLQTSGSRPELSLQTVPRGPPRKPRQSGHALWVGNLPQGATVVDLKDHFAQGAKADIESVKLISKSNCAFVNYRTREACTAAMERFHDSKFHGTRLVCRLRRSLPLSPNSPSVAEPTTGIPTDASDGEESDSERTNAPGIDSSSRKDLRERFFVMKSLTLHDLEISTRTGMWATQAHNEETLNEAFQSSENVYLFFSANKSGEYFGFARMASPIIASADRKSSGEVTEKKEQGAEPRIIIPNQQVPATALEALPRAIITPETESAPRGRVIDDMARGTIFWEADMQEQYQHEGTGLEGSTMARQPSDIGQTDESAGYVDEESAERGRPEDYNRHQSTASRGPVIAMSTPLTAAARLASEVPGSDPSQSEQTGLSPLQTIPAPSSGNGNGNAFRIEWLVIRKLPFYKCRGLRNPWNANREVKIARDGTEIETSVGQKLMQLFGAPSLPFQQP